MIEIIDTTVNRISENKGLPICRELKYLLNEDSSLLTGQSIVMDAGTI